MGLPPDPALKLSEGSAWWLLGRSEPGDWATLEDVTLASSSGAPGVFAAKDFDVGMHYAKSALYPTLFLEGAKPGETFETTARTREGLTGVTRVRRGEARS
jgi:hypothetical protein